MPQVNRHFHFASRSPLGITDRQITSILFDKLYLAVSVDINHFHLSVLDVLFVPPPGVSVTIKQLQTFPGLVAPRSDELHHTISVNVSGGDLMDRGFSLL